MKSFLRLEKHWAIQRPEGMCETARSLGFPRRGVCRRVASPEFWLHLCLGSCPHSCRIFYTEKGGFLSRVHLSFPRPWCFSSGSRNNWLLLESSFAAYRKMCAE